MKHAQGNDLADECRDANTDAANPPTLPTPTENTDIDDLLVTLLMGSYADKYPKSAAVALRDNPRIKTAKAAIEQKLNEARIDELETAIQQFIFNTKSNPHNFSEYAHARIKALQAEETL